MKTAFDKKLFAAAEMAAYQSVSDLVTGKAFFSKRDFRMAFEKRAPLEVSKHPKKEELMQEIFLALKFVPLFPSQFQNEYSLYTTARTVRLEREMIEMAKATSTAHNLPSDPMAITNITKTVIEKYPTMADEQKAVVLASCATDKNVIITEGTAGAGKSFSLNAIREIYEQIPPRNDREKIGYDIIGTALSWTATKVLESSANLSGGRAIEGFVNEMKAAHAAGGDFFKRRSVVIVDEAGLAPTESIHQILFYAKESKQDVRVILTGDSLQLNPVMAGNALELLVEECGSTRLDTIRRQKQASHRSAVKHFCYGRAENGLYTYQQQESIYLTENRDDMFARVVKDYVEYTSAYPEKTALMLALKNDDVYELNQQVRNSLKKTGRVEQSGVTLKTWDGKSIKSAEFCVGDQIVFRQNASKHPVLASNFKTSFAAQQNQKDIAKEKKSIAGFFKHLTATKPKDVVIREGVFNRTIGTILSIAPLSGGHAEFRILLSEGGEVSVNSSDYIDYETRAMPMTHNFATTIYASQGQTVQKVIMLDSPRMNRKLAYVGASRHTEAFDLYIDKQELGLRIREKIARERGKAANRLVAISKYKSSLLTETESSRLYDQYPEFPVDHTFTQREYIGVVASCWNTKSMNQTMTMARKQQFKKPPVDRHWKSPLAPWFISITQAQDDPTDDYLTVYPKIKMTVSEDKQDKSLLSRRGRTTYVAEVEMAKEITTPLDMHNEVDVSGLDQRVLDETKGVIWITNKHGEPRIKGVDANDPGVIRSRYSLSGDLVAGDGEIPVFLNNHASEDTPFFIVHSFREAVLSWTHYRERFKDEIFNVPHIICALPGVDIKTILPWIKETDRILISHGKKEGSMDFAINTGDRLLEIGVKNFDYRPKLNSNEKKDKQGIDIKLRK
jgi:hypothetical protein